MVREVSPAEVAEMRASGPVQLIDVREDSEVAICRIEGAVHLPLSKVVPGDDLTLDPGQKTICYCHHGIRSMYLAQYLKQIGFENVFNMTGGINAWALEVDPLMQRY
ncbi:MAG: hypothetical protein JSU96_17785 [Acidobacteriota bacterium]|nr:MAG: hypothetical protein JSU96_17785 [Acidobacteriota bacterium]